MSTFDDRENAFEAKFAHDADMQFRAEARCNKLAGLWAAELLGKAGEEAGNEDVVRKLAADLEGKVSADEIRAKLATTLAVAKAQLMTEI
jgi:hypothetical protein